MVVPRTTRLQLLVVCPSFGLSALGIYATDLWLSTGQLNQYFWLSSDFLVVSGVRITKILNADHYYLFIQTSTTPTLLQNMKASKVHCLCQNGNTGK